MKAKRYSFTPFTAAVPAQPKLGSGPVNWEEILQKETVGITGLATEFFTTEAAQREAQRMLRACHEQLRHGDRYALLELLDANPAFILVDWVREAYLARLQNGSLHRRRGRIRGKHVVDPRVIAALVERLVGSGDVRSHEAAFHYLAEKGFASQHTIRTLYYRGRQDSRFRPIYFEFPERSFEVSASVAESLVARSLRLNPGSRLTYRGEDPERGRVEVNFSAK